MILNLDFDLSVELHLDDVLEVLLVVSSEIYQNATWKQIQKDTVCFIKPYLNPVYKFMGSR